MLSLNDNHATGRYRDYFEGSKPSAIVSLKFAVVVVTLLNVHVQNTHFRQCCSGNYSSNKYLDLDHRLGKLRLQDDDSVCVYIYLNI